MFLKNLPVKDTRLQVFRVITSLRHAKKLLAGLPSVFIKKYMSEDRKEIFEKYGELSIETLSKPVLNAIMDRMKGCFIVYQIATTTKPHRGISMSQHRRVQKKHFPNSKPKKNLVPDTCDTKKSIIRGDIDVEILYPNSFWKLIDEWMSAKSETTKDRLGEKVKEEERRVFDIYKPLIDQYDLNYNEVSYASELTFNHLYVPPKMFTKRLYQQILQLLPDGFDVIVHYTNEYKCRL